MVLDMSTRNFDIRAVEKMRSDLREHLKIQLKLAKQEKECRFRCGAKVDQSIEQASQEGS